MKRCKLFILCCLMLISAAGNGNAEEPKPKPKEWQIRGALAALDDAIPQVQVRALEKLLGFDAVKFIPNDRIPLIIELVKNRDRRSQSVAISALGNMKGLTKENVSLIAEKINSNDWNIEMTAISALGNMKDFAEGYIPIIIEKLKSNKISAQIGAISALGNMKELAKEYIPLIVEKLNDKYNPILQIAALSALKNMSGLSKEHISMIIEELNSNDNYVQMFALHVLGDIKDLAKDQITLIVQKLKSDDQKVRETAISTLENMKNLNKDHTSMIAELTKSDNKYVQIAAISALGNMNELAKEHIYLIVKELNSNDRDIQKAAISALGDMKELAKGHIPMIIEKLKSNDSDVQRAAIYALGNMKELAKEYIPIIVEKLNSKDRDVQMAVIYTLGNMRELAKEHVTLIVKKNNDLYFEEAAVKALANIAELDAKTILGILSPIYNNIERTIKLRFLAHITGGGKEDVEILLKWIGEPENNKPQKLDHDLAKKTLKIFSEVWEASKAYKKLNEDLAQQIATVISMKDVRWTPEDLDILKAHETNLKDFPQAQVVSSVISAIEAQMALIKWTKRFSKVFGIHIGFWIMLIFVYPKSPMVQATFFWNKWIRQWIAGWVYINIALLWIPFLRKKLFEPFADTLLADANIAEFEHESYFPDSDVEHAGKRQPVFQAIPSIRGQIVLQGESGLGKSLYLRKLVRDCKGVAVFLKAERCAKGVLEAIQAKLEGIAKDTEFLKHLIYAGALDICIDGLNEVSPDTRAKISEFVESNFKGNIIMSTQPIEWEPPATAKTYILKPLREDQIEAFLISREKTFSQDARIRGQAYQQACRDYLASALCQTQCGEETETARRMLSNPMDLSIVGQMIGHGQTPNVFRLYEQQFKTMASKYQSEHLQAFPVEKFSERVFQQRLKETDNTEAPYQDFPNEVRCLENFKMVLPIQNQNKETWRFRHDKIMDYFIALILKNDKNLMKTHLKDTKFRGVYLMLAKLLPHKEAMELREMVIQHTVDAQDHKLLVEFVHDMQASKQGNP